MNGKAYFELDVIILNTRLCFLDCAIFQPVFKAILTKS